MQSYYGAGSSRRGNKRAGAGGPSGSGRRSDMEQEVMCVFNRADFDGDGSVSLQEWLSAFSEIDRDRNNTISRKEWYLARGTAEIYDKIAYDSLAHRVKVNLSMQAWREAFHSFDSDRSGSISMHEWLDAHDEARGGGGRGMQHAQPAASPRRRPQRGDAWLLHPPNASDVNRGRLNSEDIRVGRLSVSWPPKQEQSPQEPDPGRSHRQGRSAAFCACGQPFAYARVCAHCGSHARSKSGGKQRAVASAPVAEPDSRPAVVCKTKSRRVQFGEITMQYIDHKLPPGTHISESGEQLAAPKAAEPVTSKQQPCTPSILQTTGKVSSPMTCLQRALLDYRFLSRISGFDSTCQFRAVADQLFQTQASHGEVREKVVEQLRSDPSRYSTGDSMKGRNFKQYCTQMAQEHIWGDSLSLQALSDAYEVQVTVLTSDVAERQITVHPTGIDAPAKEIFLGLIHQDNQQYYSSLERDICDIVGLRDDDMPEISGGVAFKTRNNMAGM